MSRHLSPEQITRWIMGEYTAQDEEHVRDCWTCSAEVNRVKTALWLFQRSAKDWSQERSPEFRNVWSAERARRGVWTLALRWALAGLTLLVLVGIPVQTIREREQREARANHIDAVLLEQVDAEVSRAVPAPMEPLARLVPWGSTETTGKPQTSK